MPRMMKGIETMNPDKGPAIPISKSAFLLMIMPFILMIAPRVPKGGKGNGMKYGKVAGTPYFLLMKKWPISWERRIVITEAL